MSDSQREAVRAFKKELKKIIKKAKRTIAELDKVLEEDEESFDDYIGEYTVQDNYRLKINDIDEFVLLPFEANAGEIATVRIDNDGYYAIIGTNRFELIDSQYAGCRVEERLSITEHCSLIDEYDKNQRAKAFSAKIARMEKKLKKAKKL